MRDMRDTRPLPSIHGAARETVKMPGNVFDQQSAAAAEQAAMTYLQVGMALNEKYMLQRIISQNTGESTVFLCTDGQNPFVAKVYYDSKKPKETMFAQLRQVESAHVIPILDEGYFGDRFYEIQPFYENGDLLKAMPLPDSFIERVVVPGINEGLRSMHQHKIVHRDIKPNNIFLSADRNSVVIGDFGISSMLKGQGTVDKTRMAGTIVYSAPENFSNYYSTESDYYAFGMTLLHLAVSVEPYLGMTDEQILKAILTDKLTIPSTVHERLTQLIRGLTVRERKDRWGYNEVARWCRGEHVAVAAEVPVLSPPYSIAGQHVTRVDDLARVLGQNWETGKKHLYYDLIAEALKNLDQEKAALLRDCHKVYKNKNEDYGLFRALFILDETCPFYWKGIDWESPAKIGQQMAELPSVVQSDILSMLQSGALSYYLKLRKADPALQTAIEALTKQATSDEKQAYYRLLFLLNPSHSLSYMEHSFASPDELLAYVLQNSKELEEHAGRLMEHPYFTAWIEHLGFGQHLAFVNDKL